MLRFVDFYDQIYGVLLDEEDNHIGDFGFYDTVTDRFISTGYTCLWSSWKEFEEDYNDLEASKETFPLERFKSLVPEKYMDDSLT